MAFLPLVEIMPELATVTRPPFVFRPPPRLCATIPFDPGPKVDIEAPALLMTVTVLPSPSRLPLPPMLCARMPFERAPVVRIVLLFSRLTAPPRPPGPPLLPLAIERRVA